MEKEKKTFSSSRSEDFIQQEMLQLKRVTKVTKGGRRFHFSVLMLVKDDKKKAIGFALGKGNEVSTAIRKAVKKARKNLVSFFPVETRTVPFDIFFKFKATKIMIKPAPLGNGIKAGNSLNIIFKFLEIKDVSAKIIGSNNKLNVVRGAFMALDKLSGKNNNW
jgi:small subunit ribosomal protein S5